jgi:Polyketide cyclase / dehydrase and lipid transport
MDLFSATVQVQIDGQQVDVFRYIVPVDLTTIFTGYGALPAVTRTRDQTGDWDAPGQTRTVCLSDGSTAKELLTAYDYPTYFSYMVSDFTGSLRFVTTGASGEWWFAANPAIGGTDVKWRYAFKPRVSLAAPFLSFIAKVLWRGYMRKAIGLCKSEFEAHKPKLSARV